MHRLIIIIIIVRVDFVSFFFKLKNFQRCGITSVFVLKVMKPQRIVKESRIKSSFRKGDRASDQVEEQTLVRKTVAKIKK